MAYIRDSFIRHSASFGVMLRETHGLRLVHARTGRYQGLFSSPAFMGTRLRRNRPLLGLYFNRQVKIVTTRLYNAIMNGEVDSPPALF